MPYDIDLPRRVSAAAFARLERRANRKPRIALAGEFSAGKSTILNFLLGGDVLPVQATATAAPPVWLSKGDGATYAEMTDGTRREVTREELATLGGTCRMAHVETDADLLDSCDVIDLPGISDPNRSDAAVRAVLTSADMVIWCTPSTQAWRQSERSTWMSLPPRIAVRGLLAVTRADKLGSEADRAKVRRRLERETRELFSGIVMISATQALEAVREEDDDLLSESGMVDFYGLLADRIEEIRAERQAMLERYEIVDEGAGEEIDTQTAAPFGSEQDAAQAEDEYHIAPAAYDDEDDADNAPDMGLLARLRHEAMPVEDIAEDLAEKEDDEEEDEDLEASILSLIAPAQEPESEDAALEAELDAALATYDWGTDAQDEDEAPEPALDLEADAGAQDDTDMPVALAEPEAEPEAEVAALAQGEPEYSADAPADLAPEAPAVPAEALIWREIVAARGETNVDPELIEMIDTLMVRIFRSDPEVGRNLN